MITRLDIEFYKENEQYCAYIGEAGSSGYKCIGSTPEECAEQIKEYIVEAFIGFHKMEDFEIIEWPDIQAFMELEGFDSNATLIEPHEALGIGSSTYLVNKKWLDSLKEEDETNRK